MATEMVFVFRDNRIIKTYKDKYELIKEQLSLLPKDVFISYITPGIPRYWMYSNFKFAHDEEISKELEAALQIELLLLT